MSASLDGENSCNDAYLHDIMSGRKTCSDKILHAEMHVPEEKVFPCDSKSNASTHRHLYA